jgi:hypothetical protein
VTEIIDRLVELEEDVQYQESPSDSEPEFRYLPGHIPILLCAPHGAKHTRRGKPKDEDEFTAGLACLIGQRTGAHVLYARRKSDCDPNHDADAPFKQKLAEIIRKHRGVAH